MVPYGTWQQRLKKKVLWEYLMLWLWIFRGQSAMTYSFHVQDTGTSLGFSVKDGGDDSQWMIIL